MNRNEINTMIKVVYNACVQNKEKDYLDNDIYLHRYNNIKTVKSFRNEFNVDF